MSTWQAVTPEARHFLEAAAAHPGDVLLALDFDGTLAPIVDDPDDSRLLPESAAQLARLGEKLGHIAIITGRPVSAVRRLGDLDDRDGLGNLVVLGQYGVERWDAATGRESGEEVPAGVAQALGELQAVTAGHEGVHLEDKGRAIGVHTRRATDPDATLRELEPAVRMIAEQHSLTVEPGRYVLELRSSTTTKGDALLALVEETGAKVVAMCGDDLGDIPAFRATHELRDRGLIACTVASASEEQPMLAANADVVADGPAGVAEWLRALADAVDS